MGLASSGRPRNVDNSEAVPSQPQSKEFRGEVLAARDRGRSTREVATFLDVGESWVCRVKQEQPVVDGSISGRVVSRLGAALRGDGASVSRRRGDR